MSKMKDKMVDVLNASPVGPAFPKVKPTKAQAAKMDREFRSFLKKRRDGVKRALDEGSDAPS